MPSFGISSKATKPGMKKADKIATESDSDEEPAFGVPAPLPKREQSQDLPGNKQGKTAEAAKKAAPVASMRFAAPPRGGLSSIKEDTISERISAPQGSSSSSSLAKSASYGTNGAGKNANTAAPTSSSTSQPGAGSSGASAGAAAAGASAGTATKVLPKVSSFLPSFLRNKRATPAQLKYEISDELREEFERARREQQRLVQQAITEKKQREKTADREAVAQLHRAQHNIDMQQRNKHYEDGPLGEAERGSSGSQEATRGATDPRFASFFTDERVEELVQYAIYLGVDLEQQPQLVHVIRDLYYAPLPAGWTAHKTDTECDYGEGFTYYSSTDFGSRWQHPREEEHISVLAEKVVKVIPGSRIWFAKKLGEERDKQRKRFAWYTKELPDKRPLVRAGERAHFDPQTQMLDCVIRDQFPVLHAAVLVLFAKYFQIKDYPDSMVWAMPWIKIAALCPIPGQWTFKFDDVQQDAVYVENRRADQSLFSRRHPLDAFFLELLKRLRRRHMKWVAAMDPFVRDGVASAFVNCFLIDEQGYAKSTRIPLEPMPSFPSTGDRLAPLDEDSAVYQMVTAQAADNPLYKPQFYTAPGGLTEYEAAFQQQQQLMIQQQHQLMMAMNPLMGMGGPQMGLNPLAMQMAAATQLMQQPGAWGAAGAQGSPYGQGMSSPTGATTMPGVNLYPHAAAAMGGMPGAAAAPYHQPGPLQPGASGAAMYPPGGSAGGAAAVPGAPGGIQPPMFNHYAAQTMMQPGAGGYDQNAALAAYAGAEPPPPYENKQSQLKRKQYRSSSKASPEVGPGSGAGQGGGAGRKGSKSKRKARQDISSSSPSSGGSDTASEDDQKDTARGDGGAAFTRKNRSKRSDRDRALVGGSTNNVVENVLSGVGSAVMGMFGGAPEQQPATASSSGGPTVLGDGMGSSGGNMNIVNPTAFRNDQMNAPGAVVGPGGSALPPPRGRTMGPKAASGTATPPDTLPGGGIVPPPPPPSELERANPPPLAIPKIPRPPPRQGSAREASLPPVRNLPRPPSRTSSVGPPPARGSINDPELAKVMGIIRDIEECGQSPEEVLPLLNKLRDITMTVEILRKTKIGVFTQKYKSHKDDRVQSTVRDLRQQWKDLIQVMAKNKEGSHNQASASPTDAVAMQPGAPDGKRGAAFSNRGLQGRVDEPQPLSVSVSKERRRREVLSARGQSHSASRSPRATSRDEYFHPARAGPGSQVGGHHRRAHKEAFRDSVTRDSVRDSVSTSLREAMEKLKHQESAVGASRRQASPSSETSQLSVSPEGSPGDVRGSNVAKFQAMETLPSLELDLVDVEPSSSSKSFRLEGQHKSSFPEEHGSDAEVADVLLTMLSEDSCEDDEDAAPAASAGKRQCGIRRTLASASSLVECRGSTSAVVTSPISSSRVLFPPGGDVDMESESPEFLSKTRNFVAEGVHRMEPPPDEKKSAASTKNKDDAPPGPPDDKQKKAQAQAVQWLCRLFLEQRESLYETLLVRVPDIAEETRDELDIVQFRKAITNCFRSGRDDHIKEITLDLINMVFERPKWHKVVAQDHYTEIMNLWTEESGEWTMKLLPKILAKLGNAISSCQKNSPSVITELGAAFSTDNSPKMREIKAAQAARSRSNSRPPPRRAASAFSKEMDSADGPSAERSPPRPTSSNKTSDEKPGAAAGSGGGAAASSSAAAAASKKVVPAFTPSDSLSSDSALPGNKAPDRPGAASKSSVSKSSDATTSSEEPGVVAGANLAGKKPLKRFQVKKPDLVATGGTTTGKDSQLEQLKKLAAESDKAILMGGDDKSKSSVAGGRARSPNKTAEFLNKDDSKEDEEEDASLPNFGARIVSGIGAMFGAMTTGSENEENKEKEATTSRVPPADQSVANPNLHGGNVNAPGGYGFQSMMGPGAGGHQQVHFPPRGMGAYPLPHPGGVNPITGSPRSTNIAPPTRLGSPPTAFPGLAPSAVGQVTEPWRIPANVPRRLLEEYAQAPLEQVADLLRLYPAGASIITEGVCHQMGDGELLMLCGVLQQLVEGCHVSLRGLTKEREVLRTQVAQRRNWAETSYNKVAK